MRTVRPLSSAAVLCVLVGCATEKPPPPGSVIEIERVPQPPVDYQDLDMKFATETALQFGGLVTMAAAWRGHVDSLERGEAACPTVWMGTPDEDLIDLDIDFGDDTAEGMTWLADCASDPLTTDGNTYQGFAWWTATTDGTVGTRALVADATVTTPNGNVLFDYDGDASDTLDLASNSYTSSFAGEISGAFTVAGIDVDGDGQFDIQAGTGFRAQNNTEDAEGGFTASWTLGGSNLNFDGSVMSFDGFGPPDERTYETAPELENIVGWSQGIPRFTSARFQLSWEDDCDLEPHGYIGIRGNEGFWFDVFFLPLYDPLEDTAESNAYPYELIERAECDGIGTLFVRNLGGDLNGTGNLFPDPVDPETGWRPDVAPDFGAVVASLPAPSMDDYVYTLRHLPEN